MTLRTVTSDWTASYDDPISLEEGEVFWPTDETFDWQCHTWVWAQNRSGKVGWVPESLAKYVDGNTVAAKCFSAQELTCRKGEKLQVIDETHGWTLCQNAGGLLGWVPNEHLG